LNIGKRIRMNRLFADPSGRLCSIAVDHFIGYGQGLPVGLRHMKPTLASIVAARPDAVTMHKGIAAACWEPYAGQIPLIVQATLMKVDDPDFEHILTPEEAVRLGADALAVAAYVRGTTEAAHLRAIAALVRAAARFDLPVICHIYPRIADGAPHISFDPEDIAWAVHCAFEMGVDVVKAPYCGDVKSYVEIVESCPVPLVAAGGPKADTLEAALQMMYEVVQSGARGATIGRNVWGFEHITKAVLAFKEVIHGGLIPQEALKRAGL
jgi:fructose-bisphosphate aldolase, class I